MKINVRVFVCMENTYISMKAEDKLDIIRPKGKKHTSKICDIEIK